ncbi:MAG: ThiF family adenylyltransferase [Metallibacterium scheffleri]|nr:ThiF family adenylyltransferase [Metallibacterium scheffleri]
MTYYKLAAFAPADRAALRLPRAIELCHAIDRTEDISLLQVLASIDGSDREALVVDVECDEIPNRNPVGLRSPERLAIMVVAGGNSPPAVLALRQDFPVVMHLNATPSGEPRSLCLYFEPHRSVMRTWTAPKFLRRIQWWLLKTSQGALHAADQPLELPFFDTGWELVIPADFDQLRQRADLRFFASFIEPAHLRGTSTLMLRAVVVGDAKAEGLGVAIIDCPPIVQGSRTDIPSTLGAAADELARRGLNLAAMLRDTLEQQIHAKGEAMKDASDRFVVMLNMPVCREPGAPAERTQRLALLVAVGRLELGLRLGAYTLFEGQVFKDTPIGGRAPTEGDWRSLLTLPAAVLDAPSRQTLRVLSATTNDGPDRAVLVGAGALGSELLNLWTRAGWGSWTIIDSDHVKPHNLARHAAFFHQVGQPKSSACQTLVERVHGNAGVARAIVADACDRNSEEVDAVLAAAGLVVDCSTTVDFPRLASASTHTARHASVFLTPSGKGSVLLLEDQVRQCRLRTLEAQYYRALLNHAWGRHHLDGHLGSFWSGASCRDISYKLPHSSVVAHAATLAEQLIRRHVQPQAAIQAWHRNPETGSVEVFDVPVHAPIMKRRGLITVHLDKGLEDKLRQLRAKMLPSENGGVLLGYCDLNLSEAVIVDVLPPPPDSRHNTGFFERGVEGLLEAYNEVQRRTGNVVGYLGEWHSHPPGHNARQSPDDLQQLFRLALGTADDGLPVIQIIVCEHGFELYAGEVMT